MSSDVALVIAVVAGALAIFISSIPTEHDCRWQHCPQRKPKD